jgi:hypothetical protein
LKKCCGEQVAILSGKGRLIHYGSTLEQELWKQFQGILKLKNLWPKRYCEAWMHYNYNNAGLTPGFPQKIIIVMNATNFFGRSVMQTLIDDEKIKDLFKKSFAGDL